MLHRLRSSHVAGGELPLRRAEPAELACCAKSLRLIGGSSIAMLAAGEALARPLRQIFVGYDEALLAMTVRAFGSLLLVPARGRSHSWLVVLHGAERRPDVRHSSRFCGRSCSRSRPCSFCRSCWSWTASGSPSCLRKPWPCSVTTVFSVASGKSTDIKNASCKPLLGSSGRAGGSAALRGNSASPA